MITLEQHISNINSELTERGMNYSVMDASEWRSAGVNTVDEFEHAEAVSHFSDIYKDAWGFRPRWDFSSWSISELQDAIQDCSDYISEQLSMTDTVQGLDDCVFIRKVIASSSELKNTVL